MQKILMLALRGYRYLISPWIGSHCRFHPSCSEYALECVRTHGTFRGTWYTLRRLSRCHPWHAGGFDPVPNKTSQA